MCLEKCLLIDWKKLMMVLVLLVGVAVLNNIAFGLFAYSEDVIKIIAIAVTVYFIAMVGYTAFHHATKETKIKKRKKRR